jgi:hypothetical protein
LNTEELLSKHPAAIMMWLTEWLADGKKISLDSGPNWIGLAESAAGHVSGIFKSNSILETLLWGAVAIRIREELAKNESQGLVSDYGATLVRFNLIHQLGNFPGDSICDSNIIVERFFQALPMTWNEAEQNAKKWSTDRDSRSYEFKVLVERIELLRDLVRAQRLVPDTELQRWLGLLEELA